MAGRVSEIRSLLNEDQLAAEVTNLYADWNQLRQAWIDDRIELRNYLFATDTTTTSNQQLPWKNKTTLPKLTQIRDNLHANYMAALFPNDSWLRWEAHDAAASERDKAATIQSYMANKLRLFEFKDLVSQLINDFIDYGNVIADVEYVREFYIDEDGVERVARQGPRAIRRSPYDVVFNPIAPSFNESPHIIRIIKTIGELERDIKERSDVEHLQKALDKVKQFRLDVSEFRNSDINKALGYQVDGFGSYAEYLRSDYVEILEFRGDIHDRENGEFLDNHVISVIDRHTVLRKEPLRTWDGKDTMVHTAWRKRPDNVYGMGPLDNLVGMQYRIDHLENIKADLFDLIAHPPLKIKGTVEDFDWEPLAQVYVGDDGDVEPLQVQSDALQADTQIALLEQKMEEFAGAPRQAVGIRTPGEKTAFEVNILEQNASKMFQEKIIDFEVHVLEPLINNMLELARKELDVSDTIRTIDPDLGVEDFIQISPKDLKANGKIRPMGARHFAARAQAVQNYQGFRNIFAGDPSVMNHISGVREAQMFEDLLGFERFDLVRENVRLEEQAESQSFIQEAMRRLQEESQTPSDEDEAEAQQAANQAARGGQQ